MYGKADALQAQRGRQDGPLRLGCWRFRAWRNAQCLARLARESSGAFWGFLSRTPARFARGPCRSRAATFAPAVRCRCGSCLRRAAASAAARRTVPSRSAGSAFRRGRDHGATRSPCSPMAARSGTWSTGSSMGSNRTLPVSWDGAWRERGRPMAQGFPRWSCPCPCTCGAACGAATTRLACLPNRWRKPLMYQWFQPWSGLGPRGARHYLISTVGKLM